MHRKMVKITAVTILCTLYCVFSTHHHTASFHCPRISISISNPILAKQYALGVFEKGSFSLRLPKAWGDFTSIKVTWKAKIWGTGQSMWALKLYNPSDGHTKVAEQQGVSYWIIWILESLLFPRKVYPKHVSIWVTKPGQNFRNEVERRRGERKRKEAERQGVIKGSANSNALCLLPTCPSTHLNLCYLWLFQVQSSFVRLNTDFWS